MKNTYAIFYLTLAFLAAFYSSSAQITPLGDMQASRTNGKLTITVKDNATFGGFFLTDANDSVQVSFYITEDDPRNGKYSARRKSELSGKVQLIFNALDFQAGDALTFHITENLNGGIVKGYVFVDGGYLGTSVTNVDVCPISISCGDNIGSIFFTFDPSVSLVGPQNTSTPILIFAPGLSNNGTQTPGSVHIQSNSLVIRTNAVFPNECSLIMGTVVIVINGHKCVFVNGTLQTNDLVNPFANYANTQTCRAIFDDCSVELLNFLELNQNTIACNSRYWTPKVTNNYSSMCSSAIPIKRLDQVGIGTDRCHWGYSLTVKNGVMTDKVKLCKTEWCDYVFAPNYRRPSLSQVAGFIQQNKHLPGMPSAAEIEKEGGFELGDITFRQQEKIEEIFLYLIEEEQEISRLEMVLCVLEWREKLRTF
jgi:hypothetical protein